VSGYDAAVLDWGVGGLGFVWAYRELHPGARLLYLSDSGNTPYGLLPRGALRGRIREVAEWTAGMGAGRLVIACNAASSALDASPQKVPVSGIISAGISQVEAGGFRRVGVIGGRRTILSRAYATPLRRLGIDARQRVAQPLSALVEEGALAGPRVDRALAHALRGLGSVEALVLGCTHYPALSARIAAWLPGVALLDPAQQLARSVPGPTSGSKGRLRCLTTGDPRQSRRSARLAFGRDPGAFRQLSSSHPPMLPGPLAEANARPHARREGR